VPAVVLAVRMPQLLYVAGRVAVVPVLASFALAYLVNPLVERFETRGLSRTVASIAALLVVGLMGFVFLVFVIPDLWAQVVVAVRSHEPRSRALRLAPAHDTIAPPRRRSRKRTYAYVLRSMRTLRFLLVARAGRLTRIGGRQVLRLAHNPATEALYARIHHALAA
jgi:predicted PurR-regulated permease PerM